MFHNGGMTYEGSAEENTFHRMDTQRVILTLLNAGIAGQSLFFYSVRPFAGPVFCPVQKDPAMPKLRDGTFAYQPYLRNKSSVFLLSLRRTDRDRRYG